LFVCSLCHSDKTFAFELRNDEAAGDPTNFSATLNQNFLSIQAALLYTTSSGKRGHP
jgi:hypothetical protein